MVMEAIFVFSVRVNVTTRRREVSTPVVRNRYIHHHNPIGASGASYPGANLGQEIQRRCQLEDGRNKVIGENTMTREP
jgi:acyl-[acyl carrier protein]--UDP-N-acetylglucosamine O-acyltransferase